MWRFITVVVLCLTLFACKDDTENIIPDVSFSARINLDDPEYAGSNTFIVRPGGLNPRVGINGVVVYRLSMDEYYAFDLMCTHDHENKGYFYVERIPDEDFIVRCPECGSEFLIATEYGSVTEGPATWSLKAYKTSVKGNYLHIWN